MDVIDTRPPAATLDVPVLDRRGRAGGPRHRDRAGSPGRPLAGHRATPVDVDLPAGDRREPALDGDLPRMGDRRRYPPRWLAGQAARRDRRDPRRSAPVESPLGFPDEAASAAVSPATATVSPQDHLEPVLVEHYRSLGMGEIRFSTELVAFDQEAAGVTATIRDRTSGAVAAVRSRYLVGADGHRSTVRDSRRDRDGGPRRPRPVPQHPVPGRPRRGPRRDPLRPVHAARSGRACRPAAGRRPERSRRSVRAGDPAATGHAGRRDRGRPSRWSAASSSFARPPAGRNSRSRSVATNAFAFSAQVAARMRDGRVFPGRRIGAPDDATRRPGHEHGHRRRVRPVVEAGLGLPRHRRRSAARHVRGRARSGRPAQRRAVDGAGQCRVRRRPGRGRHRPGRTARRASAPCLAGDRLGARLDARPVRPRARAADRRRRGGLACGRRGGRRGVARDPDPRARGRDGGCATPTGRSPRPTAWTTVGPCWSGRTGSSRGEPRAAPECPAAILRTVVDDGPRPPARGRRTEGGSVMRRTWRSSLWTAIGYLSWGWRIPT